MEPTFQFFVELDRETMKRIDIKRAADGSHAVTTTMQFDSGWEKPETILNFSDLKKLKRFLVNEGVPVEEVDAKLSA